MEPAFRSLLYDRPGLYDLVFPEPDQTRAEMCREAFKRYLSLPRPRWWTSAAATVHSPKCWSSAVPLLKFRELTHRPNRLLSRVRGTRRRLQSFIWATPSRFHSPITGLMRPLWRW